MTPGRRLAQQLHIASGGKGVTVKTCSICKNSLPLAEFHKMARSKDGLQGRCKACACAIAKAFYQKTRERQAELQKIRRQQNRDAYLASQREYYLANRAKWSEKNWSEEEIERRRLRQWERDQTPEGRERKRQNFDRYYANNSDRYKANAARRRARLAGVPNFVITDRDWRRLVDRQRGLCFYCNTAKPLTKDHVVPIHRGGPHGIGNIVAACIRCNTQKNARTVMEYRLWLSRHSLNAA